MDLPKKKSGSKKSKHHWYDPATKFLDNLAEDAHDAAMGLIPGVVAISKSVGHDAKRAATGKGGDFQLDDISRAILGSFTNEGTPTGEGARSILDLFHGDTHGAKSHYGKALKSIYNHPLDPILNAATFFTGGGAAAGKVGAMLAKGAAEGSAARRIGAGLAGLDDVTLAPKSIRVELPSGKGFDKELARNPVIRARQKTFEKISHSVPEKTPVIGTDRRVGRHGAKTESRAVARENADTMRPFRAAMAGLKRMERKALWIVAGGHDAAHLEDFLTKRAVAVNAEIARKQALGKHKGERSLVTRDSGKVERADLDEDLAYESDGADTLPDLLEADQRDSLRVNHRNLAAINKRLAEVQKIRESGILDNPSKKLLAAAEEAGKLSDVTTSRIFAGADKPEKAAELAANRATLESRILQQAGSTDQVYKGAVRSHVKTNRDKVDVGGRKGRVSHTKPGKLAEAERNTGYRFWNALDTTDPAMYLHSARQVFEHGARAQRFGRMLEAAQFVHPEDAARMEREGFKVIDTDSKLKRSMDSVFDLLVDAESVLDASPLYAEFKHAIEQSFVKGDGTTELVPVVPKAYYDEMVGEFTRANAFVRTMIDNPTKVWRALTLNLRPAWIVNNWCGNLFLLAAAHGVRGLRDYIYQFGKRGKVVDELSPELADFSWAHDTMHDMAGVGKHSRVMRGMRRAADAMGTLNQKLTDDPFRRAAWLAEMRPHIKRIRKADPSLSWEEAAKKAWDHEGVADAVTERVLSDMIDFGDLSNFERSVVKRAIPFYAWIAGITKRTSRLVADEPWKAAIGTQIGQVGNEYNREQFGPLPSFLQDLVPLHGDTVLKTAALNPFQTPADVLGMATGLVSGNSGNGPENPLSQLNPVVKAIIEATTRKEIFTGADIDPEKEHGLGRLLASRTAASFPQMRLWQEYQKQRLAKSGELPYEPIYDPSFKNLAWSYAGVPIRTLNKDAALARALRDKEVGQ